MVLPRQPVQTIEDVEALQERVTVLEKMNHALREAFQELTALHDMVRGLAESRDLDNVLILVVELMRRIVAYTDCVPLLCHDHRPRRWLPARNSDAALDSNLVIQSHIDEGLLDWVVDNRRPTVVPAEGEGADGCYVIVPLLAGGECLGIVHLTARLKESEVSRHHIEMLTLLGNQAAGALQNIRLHQHTREMKEYFSNCLESLSAALVVLDRNRHITLVNPAAAALLGLDPEAAKGTEAREAFPATVASTVEEVVAETLLATLSEERELNYPLSTEAAETLPLGLSASLLRDSSNNLLGVILLFRDLSMTRELDHLRKVDQLKSEFVSNVSHELRTPLTTIQAYAESLKESVEPGDIQTQRQFLEVIDDECSRLNRLITDLLDLARIERGRFELRRGEVDLAPIVKRTVDFLGQGNDRHRLRVHSENPPLLVWADPDRVQQALMNLVDNAIKYSPEGGEVQVRVVREGEAWVWVEVADTGVGLAPEEQERIFEKFYRSPTKRHLKIGGSGLGLAITRYIVEAHGGRIEVSSRKGEGSTFRFSLPTGAEIARYDES